MKIDLPFNSLFKVQMLDGSKTCTSRYYRKGNIGDTFEVFGATFVIQDIRHVYLHQVASKAYCREGFSSEEAFIKFWKVIHPGRGYQPNAKVWWYKFSRET